jgi:hypothetical protein
MCIQVRNPRRAWFSDTDRVNHTCTLHYFQMTQGNLTGNCLQSVNDICIKHHISVHHLLLWFGSFPTWQNKRMKLLMWAFCFSKHSLLDFAGDTQSVSWKKLYKKSQLRSLHWVKCEAMCFTGIGPMLGSALVWALILVKPRDRTLHKTPCLFFSFFILWYLQHITESYLKNRFWLVLYIW